MLVHSRPLVHRDDGFRCRWAVAQSTVGPLGVVVFPPLFDQDLRFSKGVEDFSVKQLIPEAGVEALAESVFPGRAVLDVGCHGTHGCDPVSDGLSNELRTVTPSE